jgi:hypothetical protein
MEMMSAWDGPDRDFLALLVVYLFGRQQDNVAMMVLIKVCIGILPSRVVDHVDHRHQSVRVDAKGECSGPIPRVHQHPVLVLQLLGILWPPSPLTPGNGLCRSSELFELGVKSTDLRSQRCLTPVLSSTSIFELIQAVPRATCPSGDFALAQSRWQAGSRVRGT